MKFMTVGCLHGVVILSLLFSCGCQKKESATADLTDWQKRADSIEKQVAELRLTFRKTPDGVGLQEGADAEVVGKTARLADQLEEVLQSQELFAAKVEALEGQCDKAAKAAADAEEAALELSSLFQLFESRISELEKANETMQATLEEISTAMYEQDQLLDEQEVVE